MGGNSRAIDIRTNIFIGSAQKVDTKIFKKDQLAKDLLNLFKSINSLFLEEYGTPLWPSFDSIKDCVTGSSKFLFSDAISNSSYSSVKPFIGDIDVIIPDYNFNKLEELSTRCYDINLRPFAYLGQDRSSFGTTFLSVFQYEYNGNIVNIQVDFEKNEFDGKRPSEWARYSHSSSWIDLINGLKGAHHKLLLTNIVRVMTSIDNIVLATKGSEKDKIRLVTGQKAIESPSEYAFSVDKGLRKKLFDTGFEHEGKQVHKLLEVNESEFITNVSQIFFTIFKKVPTKSQMINFYSTIGLFTIMNELLDESAIRKIFISLLTINLYGERAQLIEKDLLLDEEVKDALIIKMQRKFPFLDEYDKKVLTLKSSYYARHQS